MIILDEKQAFIGTRRSRVLGYQTCRVWIVAIREGLGWERHGGQARPRLAQSGELWCRM